MAAAADLQCCKPFGRNCQECVGTSLIEAERVAGLTDYCADQPLVGTILQGQPYLGAGEYTAGFLSPEDAGNCRLKPDGKQRGAEQQPGDP
jgi:hypothetical protein